ncbi:hypothetical protein CC80DRAFT_191768 [Byssothecium circinans]|uniref:Uncharacterized protein n=1 Tax=Byssothecium circinans TaxID=147558 RepID=A0A6A5TFV3_9PLEO|nr:hypothetical protein CC80DRAFT_191768 [Byssothecium circinans]
MDSGESRKRPREEDNPIDAELKRRGPFASGTYEYLPSLPQHVGDSSQESDVGLSKWKLPPLCTPFCTSPTEALTTSSIIPSASSFHQRQQQWYETGSERTEKSTRTLEKDRSNSHTHWRPVRTDLASHAAGGLICCPPGCEGQECSSARALMRKLAIELVQLDSRVRSLSSDTQNSPINSPDLTTNSFKDSLQRALDLVRWTSIKLQDPLEHTQSRSLDHNEAQPDQTSTMRRGQAHLGQHEDRPSPGRQYNATPQHAYPGFTHQGMASEQNRGNAPHGGEAPQMTGSPHLMPSSSGTGFMPTYHQSPMHTPQPSRPGMLPSPSPMNFPNPPPNLPPISPPIAIQNSAQTSHLQDLQHQISVKTLALQTLQREHDSLLQKLERQRTKCAALEKKFEVSDMEINSLTDEKETLQAQTIALETQVEELQQSRDETRRQLVANGAQYMRIMEMANRLQAQSAEDKKRWDAERAGLQQRINVLEEAMVTGTGQRETPPRSMILAPSASGQSSSASSPSTETLNVLRNEIGRLRLRTQTLESALHTMRDESATIQEAVKQLLESGSRMEQVTKGAMSG